jgi:hypothetical protein
MAVTAGRRPWRATVRLLMAAAPVPGIGPASVLYEANFSRSLIIERLQDVAIMMAMGEQRAYTEDEAVAAYEAVARPPE